MPTQGATALRDFMLAVDRKIEGFCCFIKSVKKPCSRSSRAISMSVNKPKATSRGLGTQSSQSPAVLLLLPPKSKPVRQDTKN